MSGSIRKEKTRSTRHYFVDEAGDGTLFDRDGRVIVGQAGCSRYFMLGLLDSADPVALQKDMASLRAQLMADPYFKQVPSMQPEARKTACAFHAKDDVPEVRREVFNVLLRHEMRFLAVVKTKSKLLEYVRQRNQRENTYRYHANELYDFLVRVLFSGLLHKDDEYTVHFSRRGASDRTEALNLAIQTAQENFRRQKGIESEATVIVRPGRSHELAGLQAVDYFLWALQRLYERREERYVNLMWKSFRLVRDLDDTRAAGYGVYYTKEKPLTLAALEGVPAI